MPNKIKEFLTVPAKMKEEFWKETLRKNQLSLLIIDIMILVIEPFNMARVFWGSKSGLSSVNNRIYFGMYSSLFLIAALTLMLSCLMKWKSVKGQWFFQIMILEIYFLWHILLNSYDLIRDPASRATTVFLTALFGMAIFPQMPAIYSAVSIGAGYAVFMVFNVDVLDIGTVINLTITSVVSLAISITRCHHAVIEISQRREIRQINSKLQELLKQDPLTGLLNKKDAEEKAMIELAAVTEEDAAALFMLDLDDFKSVNDTYGHPCGDYVLKQTAEKMKKFFDATSHIGRIGGDEFLIVMSHAPESNRLKELGEQLICEVSEIVWEKKKIGVCCSIGILRVNQCGIDYSQLYEIADTLLYEAKRSGKGRCCIKEIS